MIDPNEEMIPLAQVAKFLPPMLRHLHASTAIRWALRGVGSPPTKIETVKIGGRRFVTRTAVDRFVARLTGESAGRDSASAERRREFQQAVAELDADGV